jgi:acyl carrier protein
MLNYCEIIRTILLDLIIAEDIDYKYDEMKNIKDDDNINISSMDKVKIVIELENYFNITINDSLLGKLDTLKDYESIVQQSLEQNKQTQDRLEALKNEVF